MKELDSYRKKQHAQIRRASIHEFLTRNRQMFEPLDKSGKHSEVIAQFQNLKRIVANESEGQGLYQCLLGLHKSVRHYQVISHIGKRADLTNSPKLRMLLGQNYQEMTILDLLVSLLRNSDQLPIISQLTYIIRYCISQYSRHIKQKYEHENTKMYIQHVKKAVLNYPFELLDHNDLQIVENITIFVYNAVICCCGDGSTIYFFVNKIKPGLLTYFNKLLSNTLITSVAYMKHELITTVLTIIYFINRYNLTQYQAEELTQLVYKLKDMVLGEILQEESNEQFGNYCQLMVILCENKQLQMTKQEFTSLQNLIPKYIYQQSQEYFNVLEKILFTHTHTLSSQSYENILRYIFYRIQTYKDYTQQEAHFKIKLLNIFHLHLTNCGNRFRPEDAEVFVFCWGEYSRTDRLINLVYFLQSLGEKASKILETMFEVIALILSMQEQLQSCGVSLGLSESDLNIFLSYSEFKTAISEYGIELSIE